MGNIFNNTTSVSIFEENLFYTTTLNSCFRLRFPSNYSKNHFKIVFLFKNKKSIKIYSETQILDRHENTILKVTLNWNSNSKLTWISNSNLNSSSNSDSNSKSIFRVQFSKSNSHPSSKSYSDS